MSIESVPSNRLENRHQRACARLAMRATLDTIHGGASALIIARRLDSMGSAVPAREIVSDVYSASTGSVSVTWGAFECPECGCVHQGIEAAASCCAPADDDD
jgi:hypothetical protein